MSSSSSFTFVSSSSGPPSLWRAAFEALYGLTETEGEVQEQGSQVYSLAFPCIHFEFVYLKVSALGNAKYVSTDGSPFGDASQALPPLVLVCTRSLVCVTVDQGNMNLELRALRAFILRPPLSLADGL